MFSTERHSRSLETRKGGPGQGNRPVTLPKLSSLPVELDSKEARKVQLWALALLRDIEQFRHRQRRRAEGFTAAAASLFRDGGRGGHNGR